MPSQERKNALICVGVLVVIWAIYHHILLGPAPMYQVDPVSGHKALQSWLTEKGLQDYGNVLNQVGCKCLESCTNSVDLSHKAFDQLQSEPKEHIRDIIVKLQNLLLLKKWLHNNGIGQYYESLVADNYDDLSSLSNLTEIDNIKQLNFDISSKDVIALQNGAKRIRLKDYIGQDVVIWKRFVEEDQQSNSVYFVLFLFLVVLPLILRKDIEQWWRRQSLVDPYKSKISWGWDDNQVVGRMEHFKVEFFYVWGSRYSVRETDISAQIHVDRQNVPFQVELCQEQRNAVKISFTTRKSGVYNFNVSITKKNIAFIPYKKEFLPGEIVPSKSTFVNHSSTIVVCREELHALHLEVRDEYSNLCRERICPESITDYSMKVTSLDSSPVDIADPLWDVVVEDNNLLSLFIKLHQPGCFKAIVKYKGEQFVNGEFHIIVLKEEAMAKVKKNVSKRNTDSYYEAQLLEANGDRLRRPKKVYCYISPKQLTIKEFYLKIIPKRLHTFRVCPATKFNYCGSDDAAVFTIDDGGQAPVTLACVNRDILAATYTKFLLKNIGGSETFKTKQDYFYQEVSNLHKRSHRTTINLKIDRYCLLECSMKATKNFTTSDWCKKFEIKFLDEEGLDWGGVSREWFGLVCDSLFQSDNKLFTSIKDDTQSLVHPNADRPQHMTKLKFYEFAGKIVGKCLYESSLGPSYTQLVHARLSRSFLAQLIGLKVTYKYFETDDPEFYTTKVKYILDNNIDELDLGLTFTEEVYNEFGQVVKVVELKPDGANIPVVDANKIQYLNHLAEYKLSNCVEEEIEAFVKGLNDLIPDVLLSMFDENELELLMCGTSSFDIDDLKKYHLAAGWGWDTSNKALDWFWTVIGGFTQEEMSRLLQFTTGCAQLPADGFSQLKPNFQITASPTHNTLPTAHTCFNQLCLPSYDSIEKLQKFLVIAVNEGSAGFGLV